MREIKFRGLGINGDWHYGLLSNPKHKGICSDLGWYVSNGSGAPFAYQIRPETIGQFTGLLDKNGKEIYEGDIQKNSIHYYISPIVFREGSFAFYLDDCSWLELSQACCEFEIIGNIYENPELL